MPKAKSAASSRRRDRQEQRRELKRAGGAAWRKLGTDPRRGSPTVACAQSRPEEGGRSALTLPRAWAFLPAGGKIHPDPSREHGACGCIGAETVPPSVLLLWDGLRSILEKLGN